MGNTFGSASTMSRPPPEGVRKINDSLYELYSTPDHTAPEVDIVFFHGLQIYDYIDAYLTTWSSIDGKQIWPQTLLSQRFPKARILSVSYDSCAFKSATTGRMNLVTIGEALLGDVIESSNAGVGQACPVVLVGHCLGGLVIKSFLLDAHNRASLYNSQVCDAQIARINNFLDNVKGVFYYATPHGGFDDITRISRGLAWPSDLLDELSTFCEETERRNQDFNNFRHKYKFSAYALYETQATSYWGGQSGQLVAEASARRDMDQAYPARADHFTICKADSKTSMAFQKLEEFVEGIALPKALTIKYEESRRRLTLRTSQSTDEELTLTRLEGRIRELFKLPANTKLVVTYTDKDKDVITMASDEDVRDALRQQLPNPLRLFVTLANSKNVPPNVDKSSGANVVDRLKQPKADASQFADIVRGSLEFWTALLPVLGNLLVAPKVTGAEARKLPVAPKVAGADVVDGSKPFRKIPYKVMTPSDSAKYLMLSAIQNVQKLREAPK